ncbi:MAG: DsrE family protein [Aquificaceae bacterium]|nr:DsrE family protein [Aquificaceae bacterium]MCX8076079.1 DsrE family protein [Aquificaceae bacterium]MDW8096143.1 DsrE family protein [Aquificaceae bacterium]MDW8434353.1 DsrE family protein [Aquificaceae bacterium]
MKFLFMVTSNPFSKDYNTLLNLVRVLSKKGEITIFFSGNGAYYTIRPEAQELKKLGVRLLYCAHSAHQRGIQNVPEIFESSSTYNLSRFIQDFDKIIGFN